MQALHKKNNQGFTLIELLIVIAIIGLLATLAIVSLTTAQRKARDTKRVADVKQIQNAVELYYSQNAAYPDSNSTSTDTWDELFAQSVLGQFITNTPVDPTNATSGGVNYVYTYGTNDANTEYFIGAELEDSSNAALTGDDDTSYSTSVSGWSALDVVDSDDATPTAVTSLNCDDATYCASE